MSELNEIHKNPVVYSIQGMEAAADVSSYVYKSVEDLDLHVDVYTPRQPVRLPAPIVILVHGEGPNEDLMHAREWGQYVSYGQILAANGLAAVTFNHRSTDQLTHMDATGEDITDALNFVRTNANEWGLDGDRLCVWAISAGVPYGVSAAVRDLPADVRCVVAYYGYLSLQHVQDELQDVRQETLEQHSPTYYLSQ